MDVQRTRGEGDVASPRHRGRTLRTVVVVLIVLCGATASVLAWQLASGQIAHARSSAPAKFATPRRSGGRGAGSGPGATATTAPPTAQRAAPDTTSPSPTTTSTAGPIRILEIGDSLGVDLGVAMQSTWSSGRVQLTMAARTDTGLTDSAYYDWPRVLAGLLASARPQVVIILLGANDLQSIVTGTTILLDGTPAWNAAYAARVTAIISESVRAGARALWVGEPAMQNAFLDAGMTRLDGIAEGVVAHYPGEAAYLSSNTTLAPGGSFATAISGPTGQEVQVRTSDGVHLTFAGSDMLAAAVGEALANAWGLQVSSQ